MYMLIVLVLQANINKNAQVIHVFPVSSTTRNLVPLYQGDIYCIFLLPFLLDWYNMILFNAYHRYGSRRTVLEGG